MDFLPLKFNTITAFKQLTTSYTCTVHRPLYEKKYIVFCSFCKENYKWTSNEIWIINNNLECKSLSDDKPFIWLIDPTKVLSNKWQEYKMYTIIEYEWIRTTEHWTNRINEMLFEKIYMQRVKSNLISVMFNWSWCSWCLLQNVHSGTIV